MSEAALPDRPRWLLRSAAWLIAGAVVLVAARRVDFDALSSALRGTAWGWVVLAALLNVVGNTVARVRRWRESGAVPGTLSDPSGPVPA